jgi:hypothetical protein
MNWDSIQKLADGLNGNVAGGGVVANEHRDQIEDENESVPTQHNMAGTAVPAGGANPGGALSVTTIFDFFQQNPNPTDQQVHQFAEQNGTDYVVFENMIFGLMTKFVNFMRHNGPVDINSVDPQQLTLGIETEMHHTPDASIAKKLALDNLSKTPDFYTRLQQMTGQATEEAGAAAVPIPYGAEGQVPGVTHPAQPAAPIKEPIARNMPGKKKEDMPSKEKKEENEMPVGSKNSTDNGTP